jgi:3-hydroxyisobutyrate dehydrogenase-like beta-hydroxyacid dehydrogenase
MRPGSIYVDLSTNAPTVARRLAAALAERQIAMLDAPVSGGVHGAEGASLSVMVGGDRAVYDRAQPFPVRDRGQAVLLRWDRERVGRQAVQQTWPPSPTA